MEFAELFKESLDKNELEEASTLLYDVENIMMVGDASWDLSSVLCTFLAKCDDEESIEFVRNATMYLCQLFGNPKELFLVYLEQSEAFFSHETKYFLLADLLQTLLLRLSSRFVFYSLELALNQLTKLISKKTLEFEASQEQLVEQSLIVITNKFVDFLEAFILKDQEDAVYNLKSLLTNSTVNLFNEPFLSLNFSVDDNMNFNLEKNSTLAEKNKSFELLKRIFSLLTKLGYNDFFKLAQELEFKCLVNDKNETLKLNKNALCSFTTYAFTQNLHLDKPHYPRVYSDLFLLKSFIPIVNFMLSQPTNERALEKGLNALEFFLKKIEPFSLEGDLLELMSVVQTFQLLFRVTTYSSKESLRKHSVDTLKAFFEKFDRKGRYTVLTYFLHDNSNDQTLNNYVSSYLVYLFKEEVGTTLDQNEDFYKSANFQRVFNLIVKMKHGNKTDLMQESSKINAILNMLRYILIRDEKNETGVFKYLANVPYLDDLKGAVQFSKESYEQQKKNLTGMQKNDTSMQFEATTSAGEKINEPSTEDKIGTCVNALQSLDLIELLRCRVVELLASSKVQ